MYTKAKSETRSDSVKKAFSIMQLKQKNSAMVIDTTSDEMVRQFNKSGQSIFLYV